MEALRAGVVGIGKMGLYHVGVLAEMRDLKLTHISDVNEERCQEISQRFGLTPVTDYKDMFGKVDVVVVAVPTVLHYPVTKDFLNAGIHVLLEKPCANNLDHAREMFDIAEKKNLILHIGHVERFNGAVQELHKLVQDPVFVECKRTGPFNQRIKDDGVVLDIMIHDIDIVLNLMQSKVISTNVMGTSVFSGRDDLVNVQMVFENGCMANIIASRASQNKIRTLSVTQKESYVLLDYTDQEIYVHRQSSSEHQLSKDTLRYKQESLIERIFVHKDNPLKLELQHFLDCVQNGTPRNVAVDKELYSLEIALGIVDTFNRQRTGT
ncbi:Oxidoreductase [Nitrospina watsonii]|uniref:Oxidoreductase n=2 Tax=Nitrospina watsonii TaxID=1323948 RepID=A0ABM9HAN3_9BACT|nr:Gfo/Idh/MocA family oxidoreductase [Nitrospina watsonii]CAI2717186.1 Oxidoreductase [Nitrospina watsonii]